MFNALLIALLLPVVFTGALIALMVVTGLLFGVMFDKGASP